MTWVDLCYIPEMFYYKTYMQNKMEGYVNII